MSSLKNSLTIALGVIVVASPAIAHNIKTSGDVAALFHIEPDHNPKAGEPSKAWFVLTKKGGEPISLDQCDCKLAIYPDTDSDQVGKSEEKKPNPIAQPPLQSISAEKYQGIPGAEVVFPQAGVFTLELSGRPKNGANFEPFNLSYDVTVQAGAAPQPSPVAQVPTTATQPTPQTQTNWVLPVALGAIALGVAAWFIKRTVKN